MEEILYINDINKFNTFIVSLILNPLNKYKMNIWNENAISGIDYSDFDLVITNPPYNATTNRGSNYYKAFIEQFSTTTQMVIVPNNWRNETLHDRLIYCKMYSKNNNIFKINSGMQIDIIMLSTKPCETHTVVYQNNVEKIYTNTNYTLSNMYSDNIPK